MEQGEFPILDLLGLKSHLVKFYKDRHSSIPLSPLFEEVETPLAGFYVMPDINSVTQKFYSSDEEEKTPVQSLKDLFNTGSLSNRDIYLSADAGFGKTAFSKYLTMAWCQVNHKDKKNQCSVMQEFTALSDFEFVFLVILRESTNVCSIIDMIEQQIIGQLNAPASRALLEDILEREECLIILDGLDEWTHPDNNCLRHKNIIPHRYSLNNVILITTRPWKLGIANLKTSQVTKKVELVQLNDNSRLQLEKNAVRTMNCELECKIWDFDKSMRERGLLHMLNIPLLLMYILCLWCNEIPIGNSKHEVYTNIIEFLFSRTSKKHPDVKPSSKSVHGEIPEWFRDHEFCQQFYLVLTSLSELAYHTLFNEKKENTLVFDRSVAAEYLKENDMKFCFLTGILTESRVKTENIEISKVSFSHKTIQEFFAAMFISSQNNVPKIVVEKCKNVQDILDMTIICEFISKMNPTMMCIISKELMSVITEDEKTRQYRSRTGTMYIDPLHKIQNLFLSCLQEMPESENIQLCLQDFFIDKDNEDSEHMPSLLKQNKTNIKSLHINTENTSSSLREIVDLFFITELFSIQKIYYHGNSRKEAEINCLLFPSLQILTLRSATWTNNEDNASTSLVKLKDLQYLNIQYFTLSHKILETILNSTSGKKSLKGLNLSFLDCTEHGRDCERIKFDLSHNSSLTTLSLMELPRLQLNITTTSLADVKLYNIDLEERSLLLSPEMLKIKRLDLSEIEMSPACLNNTKRNIENLPQLITVKMNKINEKHRK